MRLTIPKRIVFPFGYVVTVKQITDGDMEQFGSPDGCWVDEDDYPRTIFLRKRLPAKRKRYIFLHEYRHAVLDWDHYCKDMGITN